MTTENKISISVYKDELQSLIEKHESSSYAERVKFTIVPHEDNNKYKHCKLYSVVFETDNVQFLPAHVTSFIFIAGVHHANKFTFNKQNQTS